MVEVELRIRGELLKQEYMKTYKLDIDPIYLSSVEEFALKLVRSLISDIRLNEGEEDMERKSLDELKEEKKLLLEIYDIMKQMEELRVDMGLPKVYVEEKRGGIDDIDWRVHRTVAYSYNPFQDEPSVDV